MRIVTGTINGKPATNFYDALAKLSIFCLFAYGWIKYLPEIQGYFLIGLGVFLTIGVQLLWKVLKGFMDQYKQSGIPGALMALCTISFVSFLTILLIFWISLLK